MSEYKQQVINFFDQRTAYDLEGDSHPYEANKLLEFAADIQDGQTVLDLATGTGLVAIAVFCLLKRKNRGKTQDHAVPQLEKTLYQACSRTKRNKTRLANQFLTLGRE